MGREKSGSTRPLYPGPPKPPPLPSVSTHLPVLLLGIIKREALGVLQRDPETQGAPWMGA